MTLRIALFRLRDMRCLMVLRGVLCVACALCVLCVAAPSVADEAAAGTVAVKVAEAAEATEATEAWGRMDGFLKLRTMRADFKQTVRNEKGERLSEAYGVMWLRRPGYMRWEYNQPEPQLFIAGQGRWLHYDPLLLQAVVRPVSELLDSTPLSLLLGLRRERFDARVLERKNAGVEWLEVYPRSAGGGGSEFERIDIGIKEDAIRHLTLHGRSGNRTDIAFAKIEKNIRVADDTFGLRLPEEADVLGDATPFLLP